ncbi:mutS protein homolog 5 isoform X2 [Hoplias malabaricus]|uniref:mutS protein homolog 5 isoform X2 n=1 Tax=Hoplias malabaricus TaxID=27720 RepID=UPI0034631842
MADGRAPVRDLQYRPASLDGDENDGPSEYKIFLSVLVCQCQVGLSFYDSRDCTLHFMPDKIDNRDLQLLDRVIQEISPNVIITSAKQEQYVAQFIKGLASNPDYKPEIVVYPSADFGIEVCKQRLQSAHIPFLPASISEKERILYLSSCISFDSVTMLRSIGGLLKCLYRRRVGVELEDSNVGVPILQLCPYTLVLQIFKSEQHPSVYKLQSGVREGLSLYGILNHCRCNYGSKLLRQWFHRPTRDINVLKRRQEVVHFFTSPSNSDVMNSLQKFLRNIMNIPTLLYKMSLSHTKVCDWQNLYKTVYSAVGIRDTVRSLPQNIQLFREISKEFLDDLLYIATLISKVVDFEDSIAENRFSIKPNVDPVIDEKKRRMMGLSDFLTDVARAELENLDSRFTTCSVIYIPLIGFLLSVPRLPDMVEKEDFEIEGLDFIFVSENRLHYRSAKTKELDNMLGDIHCDITDMETAVMTQLQANILQHSSCLYKVLSLCAELDCLMALAKASQDYGYCSPTLSPHGRLTLHQSRHPLLELCTPVFVSNPCICSETEGKLKVLTGPNSSGKSIYLKQIGLIVFMALIGSDVPAKEAEIVLVDGIFTRMQSRESVSVGLSTFMIDLNQMSQALNYSTGMSLVLVDEFGKGTNTLDGLSLLAACLRQWLCKAPAECPLVFLATNFHSVLQLGILPQSKLLSLLTLETAIDGEELVYLYQLKEGVCQSSYAANIATLAGLPPALVQRAVEVSDLYRTGRTVKRIDQPSSDEQIKRCERVVEMFLALDLDDTSVDPQHYLKEELLPTFNKVL